MMNSFAKHADQARAGDRAAQSALKHQMEPAMARIVRRVVEIGALHSPLDARILAEARQVGLDARSAVGADGDRLVRQVAQRICSLVHASPSTPVAAHRADAMETVRAS